MENKKYDLEKAKEDCRRHEDALEEAQSCMCGHCHECGFDPSEMKAALDEVERLRSENKIISDRAAHHEKQDAAEIELLAARIKELEALNELNHKNMRSWLDTTTDKEFLDKLSSEIGFKDAYIKRLEAAFLESEAAMLFYRGTRYPVWPDIGAHAEVYRQQAREALEQLRAEGKIGGGDGE